MLVCDYSRLFESMGSQVEGVFPYLESSVMCHKIVKCIAYECSLVNGGLFLVSSVCCMTHFPY